MKNLKEIVLAIVITAGLLFYFVATPYLFPSIAPNVIKADPDGDGLYNDQEAALGTNPQNADTDNDGLNDGEEVQMGLSPVDFDTDGDGLGDGKEMDLRTDPKDFDSDDDGLEDGYEVDSLHTDPLEADTDGDGLSDKEEVTYQTDPLVEDTDNDGASDYDEIYVRKTNPLVPDRSSVSVRDTTKSGEIFQDEVWSGTILVTGDINVNEGIILTIEPGTIIRMTAHSDDQHTGQDHVKDELTWDPLNEVWKDLSATKEYTQSHISWWIEGTINAVGTPDKMILFTSNNSLPTYLDWDHLVIGPKGSGMLKYCIFEWMHAGPGSQTSNSVITHCIVRHVFWGGIHAYYASPTIENNLIEDVGHEGIDTLRSSAVIRNNTIKGTRTGGIVTRYAGYDGTQSFIENNTLINSGPIHLQMYSNAVISNNKVCQGKPEDDPKPITYMGYTLDKGNGTTGILLMDEVNVTIVNNILYGGFGIHYNNVSETFAIHEGFHGAAVEGPARVEVKGNIFNSSGGINYLDESGKRWKNMEISGNMFYNVSSNLPLENAGSDNTIVFPPFFWDFESGSAGWELEQGWSIEREDDNFVLSGTSHSWATTGSNSWSNYNFTMRFKIISGTAHITFRLSDKGRYYIGVSEDYAYFAKEEPLGTHLILKEIFEVIQLNTWYTLRLQINGNNIQIYLDDALLTVYTDDNPLLFGAIGFETQSDSHFHFDDINVIVIPIHT